MLDRLEIRLRDLAQTLPAPPAESERAALDSALAGLSMRDKRTPRAEINTASHVLRWRPKRRTTAVIGLGLLATISGLIILFFETSLTKDDQPPSVIVAGEGDLSERFPSDTLSDIVSYADQVSLVRVVDEQALDPDPMDLARGEGYVGRAVTLQIEETLWTRALGPSAAGRLKVNAEGWVLEDGRRYIYANAGTPRLEVGREYVLPLVRLNRTAPRWIVLSVYATLPIEAGTVTMQGVYEGGPSLLLENLIGLDLPSLERRLAETRPDPLALKYAHLDPEARVARVFKERGWTD